MSQRITTVFTMRASRREVPPGITDPKGKELYSSTFLFNGSCMLVGYKAKKNKVVLAMSSEHIHPLVSKAPHQKPEVILHYNSTKGKNY